MLLLNVCGAKGHLGSDFHGDERGPLLLQDVGPQHWLLGLESPPRFWFLVEHIQRLEQATAYAILCLGRTHFLPLLGEE